MTTQEASHDWELCKENAMPLKRGRDVKQLKKKFGESQSYSGVNRLKEQEAAFEEEIQAYTGNDPLKTWLKYIKWIQDSYPSGNTEKTLALLERCTREFKDDPRYVDNDKYLKIWIGYADLLPNPSTVFKFLRCHHMFDNLALFYVATAWAAERRGDFPLADKAYTKGIECEAKPIELLQKRHREFQRRMSRQWLNQAAKQQERSQESRAVNDPRTSPARRFGAIDPAHAGAHRHAPRGRDLQRLAGGVISPGNRGESNKPASSQGTSFSIYIEDVARDVPDSWGASNAQDKAGWKVLASERAATKENTGVVTGWTQGGLGREHHDRSRGTAAPVMNEHGNATFGRTAFDVYVEEEENLKPANALGHEMKHSPKLRERSDSQTNSARKGDLVHELYKKPMANFKKEKETAPSVKQLQPKNTELQNVNMTTHAAEAPKTMTQKFTIPEEPTPVIGRKLAFSPAETPAGRSRFPSQEKESHAMQMNAAARLEQADDEDMTINTKMALGDVLGMFASPGSTQSSPNSTMSMSPIGNHACYRAGDDAQHKAATTAAPFAIFSDESNHPESANTQTSTRPVFSVMEDEDVQSSNVQIESAADENLSPNLAERKEQERRVSRSLNGPGVQESVLQPLTTVVQDPSASPALFGSATKSRRRSSTGGRSICSVDDILQEQVAQFSIKDDLFTGSKAGAQRSGKDSKEGSKVVRDASSKHMLSKDLDDFDDDLNRTFDFKSLEAMLEDSDDDSIGGGSTLADSVTAKAPSSSKPFAIFSD